MIRIYGAGDDLVYIEEDEGTQEIGCYGEDVEVRVTDDEMEQGVSVTMSLGMTWSTEIQQFPPEDGTVIPFAVWVKTHSDYPDYTPVVEILDGAEYTIEVIKRTRYDRE